MAGVTPTGGNARGLIPVGVGAAPGSAVNQRASANPSLTSNNRGLGAGASATVTRDFFDPSHPFAAAVNQLARDVHEAFREAAQQAKPISLSDLTLSPLTHPNEFTRASDFLSSVVRERWPILHSPSKLLSADAVARVFVASAADLYRYSLELDLAATHVQVETLQGQNGELLKTLMETTTSLLQVDEHNAQLRAQLSSLKGEQATLTSAVSELTQAFGEYSSLVREFGTASIDDALKILTQLDALSTQLQEKFDAVAVVARQANLSSAEVSVKYDSYGIPLLSKAQIAEIDAHLIDNKSEEITDTVFRTFADVKTVLLAKYRFKGLPEAIVERLLAMAARTGAVHERGLLEVGFAHLSTFWVAKSEAQRNRSIVLKIINAIVSSTKNLDEMLLRGPIFKKIMQRSAEYFDMRGKFTAKEKIIANWIVEAKRELEEIGSLEDSSVERATETGTDAGQHGEGQERDQPDNPNADEANLVLATSSE